MRYSFLLILGALLIVTGCSDDSDGVTNTSPAGDQEFVFDVYHVNHAWAYQLRGHYVDRRGNVYRYDHSDEIWTSPGDSIPAEILREKFSRERELVGKVPIGELRDQIKRIEAAGGGPISDRIDTGCRDFGSLVFVAYSYDGEAETYQPILLHMRGDWAKENLSEDADVLYRWLLTVLGWEHSDDCGP